MSTADILIALIDATSEALHRIVDEKDDSDEFSLTFLTLSDLRHGVSELGRLEGELAEVRAELKATRAQRDATQRALHKANHDSDELRRQVTALKAAGGGRSTDSSADLERLSHGGEGHYYWVD
jgi:septal ring factor EnvC (AmiA/AmiB activator)